MKEPKGRKEGNKWKEKRKEVKGRNEGGKKIKGRKKQWNGRKQRKRFEIC